MLCIDTLVSNRPFARMCAVIVPFTRVRIAVVRFHAMHMLYTLLEHQIMTKFPDLSSVPS